MINLDAMDASEIMPFWNKHKRGRNYRDLFPQGGKGSRNATADLANYASNRYTAMQCRNRGDIQGAIMYENICDRIYGALPEHARFW